MKSVSLVTILLALLCACNTGGSKISTYATDMCGCFQTAQQKMDADAVALFEKVRSSETPQLTMQQEMAKLKPEKLKAVTDIIMSVGDKDSEISKCLAGFDKRHADSKSTDRQQLALDIANKMKEDKSCLLGSTVIYMGAKNLK